MKKGILYLRFASIEQATKDEKAQREYDFAEKYCAENGIEIIRVFDEISVKPPHERYYFDKALKVAKDLANDLTYFLVMDFSRISRKYEEFKTVQDELSSFGVYVHAINQSNCFTIEEFFDRLKVKR